MKYVRQEYLVKRAQYSHERTQCTYSSAAATINEYARGLNMAAFLCLLVELNLSAVVAAGRYSPILMPSVT